MGRLLGGSEEVREVVLGSEEVRGEGRSVYCVASYILSLASQTVLKCPQPSFLITTYLSW